MTILDNDIRTFIATFFISAIFQRCTDFRKGIKDIERSVTEEEPCRTRIRAQIMQNARDAVKVLCLAER